MAKNRTPLSVVGKATEANKSAALDAALSQIDRAFGKGSVMKLGQKQSMDVEAVFYRIYWARCGAWHWRASQGTGR